jgi:hypothetical protein
MDPLENKIRENYQAQKREDEKSIPAFETFQKNKEHIKRPVQSYLFVKVAASVIGATILLSYYFFSTSSHSKQLVETETKNINLSLPSQSLLNGNFDAGYIWKWKAPSDKLMEDSKKLLKSGS